MLGDIDEMLKTFLWVFLWTGIGTLIISICDSLQRKWWSRKYYKKIEGKEDASR